MPQYSVQPRPPKPRIVYAQHPTHAQTLPLVAVSCAPDRLPFMEIAAHARHVQEFLAVCHGGPGGA